VKRRRLLKHLADHGCAVLRDVGPHTIVRNAANGLQASVPRHREIKPTLARAICKQRDVPAPTER
jgi:predicted RNA binding protein YcfA (HicA-like mRNA interferase family)